MITKRKRLNRQLPNYFVPLPVAKQVFVQNLSYSETGIKGNPRDLPNTRCLL